MRFRPVAMTLFAMVFSSPAFSVAMSNGGVARPAWVETVEPESAAGIPSHQTSDGVYFLLLDTQIRVGDKEEVIYSHVAKKILNQQGVRSSGQLTIDYDPTYEKLSIHSVRVLRGKETIEKLRSSRLELLQREKELESQVYDGTMTATLFLSDLRVGDIIEYSYSRVGSNPIFGGRFSTTLDAQWRVPLGQFRYRLLWPSGRHLDIHYHKAEFVPAVTRREGYDEYLWEQHSIAPLIVDDQIPDWFDPYPWIQLTEWASWAEVVQWGLPLYQIPSRNSGAFEAVIRAMKEEPDDGARAIAALRFVQDEIRYMGIEAGRGSHEPRDPSLVLEQRFGDCKDKSRLLIAMLRAMGMDAVPALVHSVSKQGIADLAPTPLAFNHVIVRAAISGKSYWLDPTLVYQRGDLAHLAQPDYGLALLLAPESKTLVRFDVQQSPFAPPKKEIIETYDLRGGMRSSGTYTVRTLYREDMADNMRSYFAGESRDVISRDYFNYYARTMPGIAIKVPLASEDDETKNVFETTETYSLPDIVEEEGESLVARFTPREFEEVIVSPPPGNRSMPLDLGIPRHLTQTSHVLLPEPWDITPETNRIDGDFFDFRREVAYKDSRITFRYELKRKAEFIRAEKMGAYAALVKKTGRDLGYQLSWSDSTSAGPAVWSWLAGLMGTVLLLVTVFLSMRVMGRLRA